MSANRLVSPLLWRNWRLVIVSFFWHALFAIIPMQAPVAAGMIVAALSNETVRFYGMNPTRSFGMESISFAICFLSVLSILTALASYFRSVAIAALSRRIVSHLRIGAIHATLRMDKANYQRIGPTELQDRIVNDCAGVRRYIERVFVHAVVNVVRIGYPLVMIFVINVQLAVVSVAVLVPQMLLSFWTMRWLHEATRTARERRAVLNRNVAKLTQSLDASKSHEVCELVEKLEFHEMVSKRISALNMSNVWLFTSVGTALIWWLGARAVSAGQLGLGELVTFIGMLAFVYQPMRQFTQIANTSRRGVVALERISELNCTPSGEPLVSVVPAPNANPNTREAG